jgi:FkbM family methyltransferase
MKLIDGLRALRGKSPLAKRAHVAMRGPYYAMLHRIFPRGVMMQMPSGDHLRLHPKFLGMSILRYESQLMSLFCGYISNGMTVLDIGAHAGIYSLVASRRVGANGKIIAVEASPTTVSVLRRHLQFNDCKNIEIIAAAAGDKSDMIEFSYYPDPLAADAFANSIAYAISELRARIRMTTIDEICKDLSPGLVKIDVEGAEHLVLKGARRTLEAHKPVVLVAIHPDAMTALGGTPRELVEYMHKMGYSACSLDGRETFEPRFEEIVCTPMDAE